MKKLFLGMLISASTLTFAQQFGIKAGMNVSSISKDASLSNQKSKIGFNGGLFMNAPLSADFSIQPELLYSQYGSKATYTNSIAAGTTTTTTTDTYTTNLDYITIPVMFQYKATPEFYFEAGPEFGFLMSAKDKGDRTTVTTTGGSSSTATTSYNTDIKSSVNGFNFGLGIGAGYYFTPNIGINARYVAGFNDIAKSRPSGSDSVKNNVFQIGLAYKF